MSQQDQLNADVALLSDALTGIGKEIQDFKDVIAAQAPQLDLTALDAIAQKAIALAPSTGSDSSATPDAPAAPAADAPAADAPTDTPVTNTTSIDEPVQPNPSDVPTDVAGGDPSDTTPAPNLNV